MPPLGETRRPVETDGGYPQILRAAIEAGSSRRKFSYTLAETTGANQDSEYRALGKYLSGEELPSRERAAILAVLLQEPRLALVPSTGERRGARLESVATAVADIQTKQTEAAQTILAELGAIRQMLESRGEAAPARPRRKGP